jgi:hypothetical protein
MEYIVCSPEEPMSEMTDEEADYIVNSAVQTHKLPAQIIGDMVLEKIAASATAQ